MSFLKYFTFFVVPVPPVGVLDVVLDEGQDVGDNVVLAAGG